MMKQVQYLTHAACTALVLVMLAGCTDEGTLVGAEPPALRLAAAADALSGGSATADVRFRAGENAGKIAFAVQAAQTVSGYFEYQDLEGVWFEATIQQAPRIGDGRAAFGGPVTAGSVQFLVPT
ncbi:MAG: hypothetical protein R3247_17025, partial [Rhodothermales bacterium]|nr:hypothetical protein [Rhodothermales bacterium]